MPNVPKRVFTINEAAHFKGVSRTAIYAAISRKKLPRRYAKGNMVVHEADLLAWGAAKAKGGRPKGRGMSEASKQLLSQSQKARWASRKAEDAS